MLSGYLGHFLDRPLSSLARRINVDPNALTITGFIVTTVAAITIPLDLFLGGLLILFGGVFDMLDGIVARVNGRDTKFGAFLDSVLDRYSDAFLFLGFSWYFYKADSPEGAVLSLATMVGALLISYTRARAEGLGKDCHVGLMERPERIILMALGSLTGWILPVMWIMLVLTHATVLQRIYYVWKVMR
ncbi:MAG: CDP-alcohol phosphatidyltransferase family protein [Nitrospiraceae bacterium]|nr:MAG: CDP-alcohol phosphatidyltransferase family protein [Nitrospiraceae bacterium]